MRQRMAVACVCMTAWLVGTGAAFGQGTTGLVFGAGVENVFYDGVDPAEPLDFLRVIDSSVDDRSIGWTVLAEYAFSPWLAAGVGFEDGSKVTLDQRFALAEEPEVTFDVADGFFEPSVFDLHVAPTWPISDRVQLFGVIGVARWEAKSGNTFLASVDGDEVLRIPFSQENDRWTGIYGGGLTIWATDAIGFRARYHYVSMQQDADEGRGAVDVGMHKLAWMAVFKIG